MPTLNLPILDRLDGARSILITGIGGGFDVFAGLPLYFALQARGYNVHLANYSFSDVETYPSGIRITDTLVGITSEHPHPVVYFPELHLARWFAATRNEAIPIWAFHKTGVQPLRNNYQLLIEHLAIDTILLVDGGVDSLARGTEAEPGTFIEDSVSMAGLAELPASIRQILVCIGFGTERELTHAHILENIADLVQRDAYLGACALTRGMPEYQAYESAVVMVQQQPLQDTSVISSSIISSVRGEYGNYHLTERTQGSQLWISPLMSLCWFFDFPIVAAQNLAIPAIRASSTFHEAIRAAMELRRRVSLRRARMIPL